jgi:hypothetical protein
VPIAIAFDKKESQYDLPGKVAFRFFPQRCSKNARWPVRKALRGCLCLSSREAV